MDQHTRRGKSTSLQISARDQAAPAVRDAIDRIESAPYLVSAAHEGRRAAVIARSVGVCGDSPAMLCAVVRKGHWIGPVIRDSHRFAISLIGGDQRLVVRKFAEDAARSEGDALEWLPLTMLEGVPTLTESEMAMTCEVVRRIDLEAGYELLVGQVIAARVSPPAPQLVRLHAESCDGEAQHAEAQSHSDERMSSRVTSRGA